MGEFSSNIDITDLPPQFNEQWLAAVFGDIAPNVPVLVLNADMLDDNGLSHLDSFTNLTLSHSNQEQVEKLRTQAGSQGCAKLDIVTDSEADLKVGQFDVVLANDALCLCLDDLRSALKNIHRTLKDSGELFFFIKIDEMIQKNSDGQTIRQILEKSGFAEDDTVIIDGGNGWLYIATRKVSS